MDISKERILSKNTTKETGCDVWATIMRRGNYITGKKPHHHHSFLYIQTQHKKLRQVIG